jgi:hypothetical protein
LGQVSPKFFFNKNFFFLKFQRDVVKRDDKFCRLEIFLSKYIGKPVESEWFNLPQGKIRLSWECKLPAYEDILQKIFFSPPGGKIFFFFKKKSCILSTEAVYPPACHHLLEPEIFYKLMKILLLEPLSGFHLLSPTSGWFLEEFSRRFGIGFAYTRIS